MGGVGWTNTGHGIYSTTDINAQVSDLSAPLSSTTADLGATGDSPLQNTQDLNFVASTSPNKHSSSSFEANALLHAFTSFTVRRLDNLAHHREKRWLYADRIELGEGWATLRLLRLLATFSGTQRSRIISLEDNSSFGRAAAEGRSPIARPQLLIVTMRGHLPSLSIHRDSTLAAKCITTSR